MDSARVCKLMEELYEEIDSDAEVLTPLAVQAVLRRCAELIVDGQDEERIRMSSYLIYHRPHDLMMRVMLDNCEAGAHRRGPSQSLEAVLEQTGVRRRVRSG